MEGGDIMNNYDELDYLHENAKELSGGKRWAYWAIITTYVITLGVHDALEKIMSLFKH